MLSLFDSTREGSHNGFHTDSPPISPKTSNVSTKVFCDPVHGQISLHPVCVAFIDTPQFQRLRHIKQTGFLEYVFPGATQNRFGHSLGVCHLAGRFLRELKERQPELAITDTDILCVELAALCHDLGHGPFSHTWESYMKVANKQKNVDLKWKHELMSAKMIDYLIKENNLSSFLSTFGIGTSEIKLIKSYICGNQPLDCRKAFLHQIVNNDDSGLDVDKWDYFLRDSLYLGLRSSFEYERIIQNAKVIEVNGRMQICFRDKVMESIYNVFRTRSDLHRLAYQHKVIVIIEKMFLDALLMADMKVTGLNGEILHFWDWSMSALFGNGKTFETALSKFCMLTDDVVFACLKFTSNPTLCKMAALINSIERRSHENSGFYQHVVLKILPHHFDESDILTGMNSFLMDANEKVSSSFINGCTENKSCDPVTMADIYVRICVINWGKGSENPVKYVNFYSKYPAIENSPMKQLQFSGVMPSSFEEIQVHILCCRGDKYAFEVTKCCFEMFWEHAARMFGIMS